MHSAPPVVFPVGRFVWGVRLMMGLALVTWGLGAVWWLKAGNSSIQAAAIMALVWLLGVAASVWSWQRQMWPTGQLSWDGQDWSLVAASGEAVLVTLWPVWDGQSWVLLRIHLAEAGRRRATGYVCLRAGDLPPRWHGLRCALWVHDTL